MIWKYQEESLEARPTAIFGTRRCGSYLNAPLEVGQVVSSGTRRGQAGIGAESDHDRARSGRNSPAVEQEVEGKGKRGPRVSLKHPYTPSPVM